MNERSAVLGIWQQRIRHTGATAYTDATAYQPLNVTLNFPP